MGRLDQDFLGFGLGKAFLFGFKRALRLLLESFFWSSRRIRSRIKNLNKSLIVERGVRIGQMSVFGIHNKLYEQCEVSMVCLGDFSYVGRKSRIGKASIGKFCSIGPEVLIGVGMHPSHNFVSTHPIFYSTQKQNGVTFVVSQKFKEYQRVEIGNDVWIGARAIILDGIKIGDGAIIGAGAVVTRNVEPYSIVGGIPAKLLRHRFNLETRQILQSHAWWDADYEQLKERVHLFSSVDDFNSDWDL